VCTRILNLVFLMLISSIWAFAYNVSENEAIQVVKEYRALVDDPGKYYASETDTIVNNWRCPVETFPEEVWVNGNCPMWLIFVDEQPSNTMWSHPCKYYYVPKQTESPLEVPVIFFEGRYKAEFITHLNRMQSQISMSSVGDYSLPEDLISNIDEEPNNIFKDKLKVLYIGGEDGLIQSPNFYNDLSYFYRVMSIRYQIPDSSMTILY